MCRMKVMMQHLIRSSMLHCGVDDSFLIHIRKIYHSPLVCFFSFFLMKMMALPHNLNKKSTLAVSCRSIHYKSDVMKYFLSMMFALLNSLSAMDHIPTVGISRNTIFSSCTNKNVLSCEFLWCCKKQLEINFFAEWHFRNHTVSRRWLFYSLPLPSGTSGVISEEHTSIQYIHLY